MPLRYLLDTDNVSDLVRHPQGAVAKRISVAGEDTVCTSIVVAAELRYGAEKSASKEIADRVRLVLSALAVLAFEAPADQHYADIRHQLALRGTPIGPNDLLIAAQARSLGLAVVTANEREFTRVPGLEVENWIQAGL